jgi:hypothetical protein
MVREGAGVWDAKEKQVLFKRQAEEIKPDNIARVETPHANMRKKGIPYNEKKGYSQAGQHKKTPLPVKIEPWVKREQQRENDAAKVNRQVNEFIRHWHSFVWLLL